MSKRKTITDVARPQEVNANRHTERGMATLERSMQDGGWIGAITTAADGETFDGSARVEKAATLFADAEPIIVETDGTRPVIVRRTDIATADDPRAVRLGLAANRVAQLNLEWEPEVLQGIFDDDAVDLAGLFTEFEASNLAMPREDGEGVDPADLWKGMPEFEQEELKDKYKSLIVHFATREDYEDFARLVNQTLTDKSVFIWYPYRPTHGVPGSMKDYECAADES